MRCLPTERTSWATATTRARGRIRRTKRIDAHGLTAGARTSLESARSCPRWDRGGAARARLALFWAAVSVPACADKPVPSAKGSGLIQFGPNREEIKVDAVLREDGGGPTKADVDDISAGGRGRIGGNCL